MGKKLKMRAIGFLRPNPKSLTGDKVHYGIGLRSTLAHGKFVKVDSGVDKNTTFRS
jgi:hypothetical protein